MKGFHSNYKAYYNYRRTRETLVIEKKDFIAIQKLTIITGEQEKH